MTWQQFYFESSLFFDTVAGPEDWMRLKAAYPNMSDSELLDAREATYGGQRTKADRDATPNYGLRYEHDGARRLRDFFEDHDMLRLLIDQDATDAARYRWLRSQHWEEGTLSVVSAKRVLPGSDCPSYRRLDEIIDRMMMLDRVMPDTSKPQG